jgi:hypothetical protein
MTETPGEKAAREERSRALVLPCGRSRDRSLGRLGKGEQAVKGTYAAQIANIAHEPGVRQQL